MKRILTLAAVAALVAGCGTTGKPATYRVSYTETVESVSCNMEVNSERDLSNASAAFDGVNCTAAVNVDLGETQRASIEAGQHNTEILAPEFGPALPSLLR